MARRVSTLQTCSRRTTAADSKWRYPPPTIRCMSPTSVSTPRRASSRASRGSGSSCWPTLVYPSRTSARTRRPCLTSSASTPTPRNGTRRAGTSGRSSATLRRLRRRRLRRRRRPRQARLRRNRRRRSKLRERSRIRGRHQNHQQAGNHRRLFPRDPCTHYRYTQL
ncbi:MAG: hypothetical protein BJ554DRAFT_6711 [Olpidium bornovanus]|uniref:Uncharacterized protein n=1 Tax=Olpidium bornovanus TaxID=278681 RepID=A0A8H7ZX84_9FUNG|nr:MAG: hypothetical protein BJ554DRAFT_6711 [Olpidium bornovanus]